MGLFDSKSSIIGAALGVSGAFDKRRKTDKAAAFGAPLGASIGSGQKWTMADSLRLGAAISALDAGEENTSSSHIYIAAVVIAVMTMVLRITVVAIVVVTVVLIMSTTMENQEKYRLRLKKK